MNVGATAKSGVPGMKSAGTIGKLCEIAIFDPMNGKQRTNLAKYCYDLSKGFVLSPVLALFNTTAGFDAFGIPVEYVKEVFAVALCLLLANAALLLIFAYKLDGKI